MFHAKAPRKENQKAQRVECFRDPVATGRGSGSLEPFPLAFVIPNQHLVIQPVHFHRHGPDIV